MKIVHGCHNFVRDSVLSGLAVDNRYSTVFSSDIEPKPNGFYIQNQSGVLDTLKALPLFM